MKERPYVGEEVKDLRDLAEQLAAEVAAESGEREQGHMGDWRNYLEPAAQLLVARELKYIRHHLAGEE